MRTGIKIHGNVGQVQLLQGVVGTFQIGVLGISALFNVEVGDQVGQTVGLW